MNRIMRIGGLALLLPLSLSLYVMVIATWFASWAAVNFALATQSHDLPALSRGVAGASRSAEMASWVLRGWGSLSRVTEAADPVAELGIHLRDAARIGRASAPGLTGVLGGNGPRRYLICSLNDAELFGSGGAPLDVAVIEVDHGRPQIVDSGSAGGQFNPGNEPYVWDRLGGLPWYQPGKPYPFANANFHPDFALSGPNMISAWEALDRPRVDGVITIDMYAVAAVLQQIGPIESEGYGELTSENIIRKVLVDSYRRYPESTPGAQERRRAMNDSLRGTLLSSVTDWRSAVAAFRGIWSVIPGRHVQGFMRDPQAQALVEAVGAQATLGTKPGDVLGVFLQSGVSKLAIFQKRRIEHDVVVYPDGSADVSQLVSFRNEVPDSLPGERDSYRGYLALTFRQRVAYRMPFAALQPRVEAASGNRLVPTAKTGPFPDESGAQVMWQGQDIPPGETRVISTTYRLPPEMFGSAGHLNYVLTASPQATVLPADLIVRVRFEGGAAMHAQGEGWRVQGDSGVWAGTLDRVQELQLRARWG